MGLITKEVEVKLCGNSIKRYESLGYEIPRYYDKYRGRYVVKEGTTITVKVEDLTKGSNYRVDVKCDCCGEILHIPYHKYYSQLHDGKHYCHKCALKIFNSGENNSNWRADLSEEERINKRSYPEYTEFVKKVFARDNYTCQCCGQKHGDLEVHHLNGYSWFIEGRTDETNAILLCSTCHKNYHIKYGNKNARKEDFEEWFGQAFNDLKKYNGTLPIARKIYCFEEDKIYNNAKELKEAWNLKSESVIYDACNRIRGIRKTLGKHIFWLNEYETMSNEELQEYLAEYQKDGRSVICITTNEIYPRIIDAQKATNLKSPSGIRRNCIGIVKSAGKLDDGTPLQWMYYDEYLEKLKNGKEIILGKVGTQKVICITTGETFNSMTRASNAYGLKQMASIYDACNKGKSAGKLQDGTRLKWMYYEDFLKLPQEEQNEILARNKDSSNDGSFVIHNDL